jgi:pimeloyl-ACP methyl ester carboxylesterase
MTHHRLRCHRLIIAAVGSLVAIIAPASPALPGGVLKPIRTITVPRARGDVTVTVYQPRRSGRLAVILPGMGIRASEYSFIARELVARGYTVAAIEIVLPADQQMPSGGDAAIVRRPFWMDEARRVRAVIGYLRRRGMAPGGRMLVVGHSNGGDVAMLLATLYPDEIATVFSLDNRRMPFPRLSRPRLCSIRSRDHPADPGVIPTVREMTAMGAVVVGSSIRHDDMFDGASPEDRAVMLGALGSCLG